MFPYFSSGSKPTKKYTIAFKGINYSNNTQEGEFSETYNLSTKRYPCLAPREGRVYSISTNPAQEVSTLFVKGDKLYMTNTDTDGKFKFMEYGGGSIGEVEETKKQIASVGNYILIFPDKKYYNVETKEFGNMEETYSQTGLVFKDSTITTTGADFPFRPGDGVTISGCSKEENNITIIIREVNGNTLTFYENSFTGATETGTVTIKREIPELEFVCESGNRLWGVKGNTIYASKFSDPLNFKVFDGLTGDSYYIDVGSDGEFTGCIPYSTYVCFFKENTLHKVYGNKPSNFQVNETKVFGVQSGSERSLQAVNEMLIYKGVNGVYAYTGGVPTLISENFGNKRFSEASACSDGEKYYISMKNGNTFGFYSYDIGRGIWLKEDDLRADDMVFYNNKVHLLREYVEDDGVYRDVCYIDDDESKEAIEWSATFCPFNETINERKVYSKFHLRLDLAEGAWIAVDIKTNNDYKWRQVYVTHDSKAKTISIPIMPERCDSIEVRIRGKRDCTIRSFVREYRTGSDV